MEKNTFLRKLNSLLFIENIKLKDYIYPFLFFIVFTILSFVFFTVNKGKAIWANMEVAGGNAFHFCEHNNLNDSLVQSSNTWSNLGFLIVSLLILFYGIKDFKSNKNNQSNLLLQYPIFSLIIGLSILYLFIGSFFYHASVTFIFQKMDQTGMYAILLSFMAYNVFRIWPEYKSSDGKTISTYKYIILAYAVLNLMFFTFLWKININILYTSLAFSFIAFTIIYNKKNPTIKLSRKMLLYSLYIYLFSMGFWMLDRKGIFCDPESVFQGHALWHILNAIVLMLIYLHYRVENKLVEIQD